MTPQQAEILALQALTWLAGQDEIFHTFLGASGAAPQDLAARANEPQFLGMVMDFVLQEDEWVLEFARQAGIAPQQVMVVRQALPGGQEWHWT